MNDLKIDSHIHMCRVSLVVRRASHVLSILLYTACGGEIGRARPRLQAPGLRRKPLEDEALGTTGDKQAADRTTQGTGAQDTGTEGIARSYAGRRHITVRVPPTQQGQQYWALGAQGASKGKKSEEVGIESQSQAC
jgi:hypothetical protein